jgi:Tol biopolymer transport system component
MRQLNRIPFNSALLMRRFARAISLLALVSVFSGTKCFAQYENPRFSPDERSLVFDFCEDTCGFVIYSLDEGIATSFAKPKDENWILPSFGPSSGTLTFVVNRGRTSSQVAIVKVDGTGFDILTTSDTFKRSPSFSPDGKDIVFTGNEFKDAGPPGAGVSDVYLVRIATRVEQRITDLRVLGIGAPFFMPDGERFVFSTVGSARPRSGKPVPSIELERLYPNRKVFVLPFVGQHDLEPFVRDLNHASQPMPLKTGEIAVVSRVNEIDGIKGDFVYDIFLATSKGSQRHTHLRSYIRSYGISSSGELVAFAPAAPRARHGDRKLLLWRKSAGKVVELAIPHPRMVKVQR